MQAFPAFFAAAGAEPDHLRERGGEMLIEAVTDGRYLLILPVREAAAEVGEHYVAPVAEPFADQPAQPPAPAPVESQRQPAQQAEQTPEHLCAQ